MGYVYCHIREDKNEIFYIGVGFDSKYKRACSKHNRNKYWKNITSKTKYKVEILFDNLDKELCFLKEIELIKNIGRAINNKGPLCNITAGGEGTIKDLYKPILQIDLNGAIIKEWKNVQEVVNNTNFSKVSLYGVLNHKRFTLNKNIWCYKKKYSSELIKTKLELIKKAKIKRNKNTIESRKKNNTLKTGKNPKLSKSLKDKYKTGYVAPMKGKIHSKKTRSVISKKQIKYNYIEVIDTRDNKLYKFDSIKEVSKFFNLKIKSIYNSIRNNTELFNFKFKVYENKPI